MIHNSFYAYLWLDPRNQSPFYAGKGSGYRARDVKSHSHNKQALETTPF